ncbi:uncharacterized protein BKA78DRAFT_322999 [Phyllosticta capitalensis]|uniref:F-box domain-containing protein n=1 Tax=Phyllosticta capitalensis TaxID=121624 RepID=A0ABR1YJ41_9PEZI
MATFDDLNDDVLLLIIDILFDQDSQQDPSGPPCDPLTAFSCTNRRLRLLATEIATRPLFYSVSIWGGTSTPPPALELIRGERLDIPPGLERTRYLRIPNPFLGASNKHNKKLTRACLREFARLLSTPKHLEKLDVQYSKVPDDLSYPFTLLYDVLGIDPFHYDRRKTFNIEGGRACQISLPFTLDHVKELWIHARSNGLVLHCPNVKKLGIRTECHPDGALRASEDFNDLLSKCPQLPHLVDLEIDMKITRHTLEIVYAALPNLERLALTGNGIRFLPIQDREEVVSQLSLFPRLRHFDIRHPFKSSSRPWGDSPDEPPDYRMDCLVGGYQGQPVKNKYFARHAVRFFEECMSLQILGFLPSNYFRLLTREPGLTIKWLRPEDGYEVVGTDLCRWGKRIVSDSRAWEDIWSDGERVML